jgi:ankyrin repeat protein
MSIPDIPNDLAVEMLCQAAHRGDVVAARRFGTRENVVCIGHDGLSPLHFAVGGMRDLVLKFMVVELGADVNVRADLSESNETPLHRAAMLGRIDTARVLVEHGALIDAVDANGHTPLYIALSHGRQSVATLLLDHGASWKSCACEVPKWVDDYVKARDACRRACVALSSLRCNGTRMIDINVLRLMGKHLWSFRKDQSWALLVSKKQEVKDNL